MNSMVERAAKAFDAVSGDERGSPHSGTLAGMRAALQAALDPKDEDVVLIVFNAMHDAWGAETNARAAIAALRAAAQEQKPHD